MCFVLLACSVYGDVFNNLVLIYSAFVLFGLKSEDLDVKVSLPSDLRCVELDLHSSYFGYFIGCITAV